MLWTINSSPLLKEYELRTMPVIVRVNEFTEKSAREFGQRMALAHSTGQKIIPILIDSYGGQVYSLLSMISDIEHSSIPVATIAQGKNCGKKDETYFLRKLKRRSRADWYLTPQDCIRYKIANHIRVPKMNVDIDVKIHIE